MLRMFILVSAAAFALFPAPARAASETEPPKARKRVRPSIEDGLMNAGGIVTIQAKVNRYGYVIEAAILDSTNPKLNQVTLDAFHHWRFRPAHSNGTPYDSIVVQPFIYRGDGQTELPTVARQRPPKPDRDPKPRRRVAPSIERDWAHLDGTVILRSMIDESGRPTRITVVESSHPRLAEAAREAFEDWRFKPAREKGRTVARQVEQPFDFIASRPAPAPKPVLARKEKSKPPQPTFKPARPIATQRPKLPAKLRGKRGEVNLLISVDEAGLVKQVEVTSSTDPEMTRIAARTALRWKFAPATHNGSPVPSQLYQPFVFNGGLTAREQELYRNPVPTSLPLPELPGRLQGLSGYAHVELQLDERGKVVKADASDSSDPALERISLQAAEAWSFDPALRKGQPVPSTIVVPLSFDPS